MSSIDNRIVKFELDNDDFYRDARATNDTLDDLKAHLQLEGGTKGLDAVQDAASNLDLHSIAAGVETISGAFTTLGIIGINVLSRLTQDALSFASNIAGKILDPIVEGGIRRAQNIEQARFQLKGLGLDVERVMEAALGAVKNTAFGLDEAAKAASNLAASQVPLDKMQGVLRGIAGVAAMTGSGYADIADVFQKVAGQGRLMGDDLNRLAARGLNAAAILGDAFGKSEADIRKMVSENKISFQDFSDAMTAAFGEHATKANETYSGSLSNMRAALARIGATLATPLFEAQRKSINALTPVIDKLHEALKPILNIIAEIAGESSDSLVKWLNGLDLGPIQTFGAGIAVMIRNLKTALDSVIKPIVRAFEAMFDGPTINGVYEFNQGIIAFIRSLVLTDEEGRKLRQTFQGIFAVFDILGMIISGVVGMLFELFGGVNDSRLGFLDFTATVGNWLVSVRNALRDGEGLAKFFSGLKKVLQVPIYLMQLFAEAIGTVITAIINLTQQKGFDNFAEDFGSRFSGLAKLGQFLVYVWEGVLNVFRAIGNFFAPVFALIGDAIKKVVDSIGQSLSELTFDDALNAINTGLFGGVVIMIKKFFDLISGLFNGDSLGPVSAIKSIFGQLESNLKTLQQNTQAKTLKEIAIAVALLAAAAIALTFVDPIKLGTSLAAMTVMMGQLLGSLTLMVEVMGNRKLTMLPIVASAMIIMASAMVILAGAIAIIGALPLENAIQGVAGITIALGAMVGAVALLNSMGPRAVIGAAALQMIAGVLILVAGAIAIVAAFPLDRAIQGVAGIVVALAALVGAVALLNLMGPKALIGAAALGILAGALILIASAIAILGALPLEAVVQGGVALVVILGVLVGAALLLSSVGPMILLGVVAIAALSASLIVAAIGLTIFASAMLIFATMSWDDIGRSLTVLAAGLLILAVGMAAMTAGVVGAGIFVVAATALTIFAGAMKIISSMSWDEIGRSMVVLAGGLGVLALAAFAFQYASGGVVAMIGVAGALTLLAPALKVLGSMSWEEIGRGLTVLAAALGIIAVMGILVIPASVGFLLLGAAILMLGAGLFLGALGAATFAAAMAALVAAGTAGLAAMVLAINAFAQSIPLIAYKIAEGIIVMIKFIGDNAPVVIGAVIQLIVALLEAIRDLVPLIIEVVTVVISAFIDAAVALIPKIIEAGLTLIESFLQSIADHVDDIVELALTIIANFLDGISRGLPKLIDSGINLIISFIGALSKGIRDNIDRINRATTSLILAIADGIAAGIRNNTAAIRKAGEKIGAAILDGAKNLLQIRSPSRAFSHYIMPRIYDGIDRGNARNIGRAEAAGGDIGIAVLDGMKSTMGRIAQAINTEVDANPTITPVINLDQVKKDASQLGRILSVPDQMMSLNLATDNAVSADAVYEDRMRVTTDADGEPTGQVTNLNYTQINNSPKPISAVETFRNTRNQLSVTKEALKRDA